MANNPLPVAKSKVSIGTATAEYTEAALAADTYVLIDGIRTIGNFGDTFSTISVDEVGDGRTRKAKGVANAGTMELTCSRRINDAGQIAMVAAAESPAAFNFKIELPNGDGTFETNYVSALVMSKAKGLGGPNDTQTRTFTLEVNEAPIEIEPVVTP